MAISNSIVDYLKNKGQDSSYSARKKLAQEYGMSDYSGTAAQNTQLLNALKSASDTTKTSTGSTQVSGSNSPTSTASVETTVKKTTTPTYTPSQRVSDYSDALLEYEQNEPDAYDSQYENTINEILNTIKNKGSFDLSSDVNYQQLFNNYKEQYQASANKAMRNAMANANAQTGGYGSTYGQIAGQQAYDSAMEGLNSQNLNLMQLAYQMYGDDVANDYNKLSAFQSADNTDYSRYRDSYNDWYNNRNYYANQYQNTYANDYSNFQNEQSAEENLYNTALNYAANGYELPSYLQNQFSDEDNAYFENIASQALQLAQAKAASGGKTGNSGSTEEESTGLDYDSVYKRAQDFKTYDKLNQYLTGLVNNGQLSKEDADRISYTLYGKGITSTQQTSSEEESDEKITFTLDEYLEALKDPNLTEEDRNLIWGNMSAKDRAEYIQTYRR